MKTISIFIFVAYWAGWWCFRFQPTSYSVTPTDRSWLVISGPIWCSAGHLWRRWVGPMAWEPPWVGQTRVEKKLTTWDVKNMAIHARYNIWPYLHPYARCVSDWRFFLHPEKIELDWSSLEDDSFCGFIGAPFLICQSHIAFSPWTWTNSLGAFKEALEEWLRGHSDTSVLPCLHKVFGFKPRLRTLLLRWQSNVHCFRYR